ncbi:hypothetical protein EYV94_21190 [Puteibacter caeruleilacunae]|nr:hypothetical protein EYV94_21190 [Puteibacter caeruleilacunae]
MRTILLLAVVLSLFTACQEETKMLIAGSGFKKIVEIDRATKQVLWEHPLQNGDECNQVAYTKDGNVFYSHKKGASLVNKNHDVLWHLDVEEGCEIQSASITKEGNLLVGQCGNPTKIFEYSPKGEKLAEIQFNMAQKRPHGQFRRVMKYAPNQYYVVSLRGEILKLDGEGNLLDTYTVGKRCFDFTIVNDSKWIVSYGDGHAFGVFNPETRKVEKTITNDDMKGFKLKYAGDVEAVNGSLFLANWGGHARGTEPQPQIFEFDKDFNIVWSFQNNELGNISAICLK